MKRLMIIGNSHAVALKDALRGNRLADVPDAVLARTTCRCFGNAGLELTRFWTEHDDRIVLELPPERTADGLRRQIELRRGMPTTIGLCYGTHHARIYGDPLFAAAASDEDQIAGHVSRALRDEMIAHDKRNVLSLLDALQRMGLSVFVIAAPPPRDEFATPRRLVRELYDDAQRYMAEQLRERGIGFVLPPPDVVDADGFLLPELGRVGTPETPDRTHGNEAYGARMLRTVLEHHFGRELLRSAA